MHQQDSSKVQHTVTRLKSQQVVGGAIIDAQGREVPITEQMILQACRELEKNWHGVQRHA